MSLRSKLIRLAHEKPELREKLLPLLGNAKQAKVIDPLKAVQYLQTFSKKLYNSVLEDDRRGTFETMSLALRHLASLSEAMGSSMVADDIMQASKSALRFSSSIRMASPKKLRKEAFNKQNAIKAHHALEAVASELADQLQSRGIGMDWSARVHSLEMRTRDLFLKKFGEELASGPVSLMPISMAIEKAAKKTMQEASRQFK